MAIKLLDYNCYTRLVLCNYSQGRQELKAISYETDAREVEKIRQPKVDSFLRAAKKVIAAPIQKNQNVQEKISFKQFLQIVIDDFDLYHYGVRVLKTDQFMQTNLAKYKAELAELGFMISWFKKPIKVKTITEYIFRIDREIENKLQAAYDQYKQILVESQLAFEDC